MSRRFGKVVGTVWASRRFRNLATDTARLAYIYLHTNGHGNCIGAYRLPPGYIAEDMRLDPSDAEGVLSEIEAAGLIRRDTSENIIQIEGWFAHNPITNRKHLQAAISAQADLPRQSVIAPRVAVEVAANMIVRVERWSTEKTDARMDALRMCREMLLDCLNRHEESLIWDAMDALPAGLSKVLPIALSITKNETCAETETRDTDKRHRQRQRKRPQFRTK